MNKCKNCGAEISSNHKFCPNCGTQNVVEVKENEIKENKKSNYNILIIICIVLIVVSGVLLYLFLNRDDNNTNNDNVNIYEDNNNSSNSNNNSNNNNSNNSNNNNSNNSNNNIITDNNDDVIEFKGFKFLKNKYFDYSITGNSVSIKNNAYFINVSILAAKYDTAKYKLDDIQRSYDAANLKDNSIKVSNLRQKYIGGTDLIMGDAIVKGSKALWFIIKASDSYVYQGYVLDRNSQNSETNLSVVASLLKNTEYVGNYSNYSTSFDDLSDIESE